MIHFIGLGAQKAGTSWIYACLYEHPEICAPIKELHFFSRERFSKGKVWYESHFSRCDGHTKCGEFSTSYLYDTKSAERIAKLYPEAKLIAVLRNPIERAYSHYINAQKAGQILKQTTFAQFINQDASVLEQGKYSLQLYRYLQLFSQRQLLILLYEDIKNDPATFIKQLYLHLEVNPEFEPTMLHERVNIARIPVWISLEKWMHHMAERLRRWHLDKFVWFVRRTGIPRYIRVLNTGQVAYSKEEALKGVDVEALKVYFKKDVDQVSMMIGRNVNEEWGI